MAKLEHTLTRLWIIVFGFQKMSNFENAFRRLQMIIFGWSYGAYHQSDNLQLLRWNSHLTSLRPKDGQFAKYCRTSLNHCFSLVLLSLSSARRFAGLTVNSLFNLFTTKIMGTLESTVKRLIINNIPKTSVCFEYYITTSDSSFTLNETHCGVVHRLVSSLRVDKATGLDGISAKFLKEACAEIVTFSHPYN